MLNFKIVESQKLIFSRGPVVAADTTNLEAKFEVNDLFDGTLRAYWNVRGSVVDSFKVDLDASGICTIPSEVLASISDPSMYGDIDHILQVSVVSIGDDDTIRITSTTCEIPVYKSSYTGNISQPSKPSGGGNITNIITGAALNGKQLDFYNGNNVIFSAPLDRLDSFLLPLLGGKMQGDINMDGNAITGIPDAEGDTDALALAFAKTLFAPSGYVTDVIDIASESELDTALTNIVTNMPDLTERHVVFQDNAGIFNGGFALARIFTRVGAYATATFETYGYYGYTKWVKNRFSGTWYPLEWENPPMVLGVEYRTTERCEGKPVYTKRFTTGEVTTGTNFVFTSESIKVVEHSANLGDNALPYYAGGNLVGGTWSAWYEISGHTFIGRLGTGRTVGTFNSTVKYIKL